MQNKLPLTYVVTENCIKCKYTDCVEVCPVDCFYEGENMLIINPDECIDCGVCEAECPANAIAPDYDNKNSNIHHWLEINRKYSQNWPKITRKKAPHQEAEQHNGEEDKFNKYFADNI